APPGSSPSRPTGSTPRIRAWRHYEARDNPRMPLRDRARPALAALLLAASACRPRAASPDRANGRLTRLTRAEGLTLDAALSPDGGAIAYSADRSGRFEIYVRSLDDPSSRERSLTS